MHRAILWGASLLAVTASGAQAVTVTYNINANGAQEVNASGVPNQGDPDGSAVGTLTLDNGTGSSTTGSATFAITLNNVDLSDLRGHHIHQAPAGSNGSIVVDFGDPDTLRTGNVVSGTVTGLPAATITNVFNNPTNFYYNLHNGVYPPGAVRFQLPEPTTLLTFAAATGLFVRRRRK